MRDTCLACGKPIFTIRARGMGITLAQQWTHGSRRKDRKHMAIPTNRCQACPADSDVQGPWLATYDFPDHERRTFTVCAKHAAKALANGAATTPAPTEGE